MSTQNCVCIACNTCMQLCIVQGVNCQMCTGTVPWRRLLVRHLAVGCSALALVTGRCTQTCLAGPFQFCSAAEEEQTLYACNPGLMHMCFLV